MSAVGGAAPFATAKRIKMFCAERAAALREGGAAVPKCAVARARAAAHPMAQQLGAGCLCKPSPMG